VAALARRAAAGTGVAVRLFDPTRVWHWIIFVALVLLLVSYLGLLSWGRLGEALEALAEKPSGAQVFHAKIDRADAIFMVFAVLVMTPIALVATGALIAFVGSVLTGLLEAVYHRPGMPDWVTTLLVYFILLVVAIFTRSIWFPQAQGLASLIARAMIAATQ
jgi:hypothetical protein